MKKKMLWSAAVVLTIAALWLLRGSPFDAESMPEKEPIGNPVVIKGRPIHYHEVLVGYRSWFDYSIVIYNDLNSVLSDDDFFSIDPETVKENKNADVVIMNGPRYWVLDEIMAYEVAPERSLGGHQWAIPGAVKLSLFDILNRKPYVSMMVKRDTKYTYYAGSKVYRLIDDTGQVFTMQALAQTVDPDMSLSALDSLNDRLSLPRGWRYRVEVLDEPLIIESGGTATILQDDFQNTYQLTP
ncbi:hypothetical protein [Endozoicomonas ascidiicola]|uniref:hypothetical protein n=1 Tax=Endozoicomonas ascidiicola TaxID=1698521 RepID=UPI00082A73CE|nr:hypothetical protein [Endozoicomonas ascidiicola]